MTTTASKLIKYVGLPCINETYDLEEVYVNAIYADCKNKITILFECPVCCQEHRHTELLPPSK